MRLFLTAICFTLCGVSVVSAQEACSPATIQAKQADMTAALQSIAAKDAARGEALASEIQDLMTAIQTGGDLNSVCVFFDDVIAEAAG